MKLFQVNLETTLKRRFFIEAEDEDEAREAVDAGLGDSIEPHDEEVDVDAYELPPDANPSGPRWVGGEQGRWA